MRHYQLVATAALAAGLGLFTACGTDDIDASPGTAGTGRSCLNISMDLADDGIQSVECTWPGHGECLVVGESVGTSTSNGRGIGIGIACDLEPR